MGVPRSPAKIAAGVGAALGVIGSAIAALVLPIGLVVVAIAALGTALIVGTGIGGEVLDWLGEQWKKLRNVDAVHHRLQEDLGIGDFVCRQADAGDSGAVRLVARCRFGEEAC